MWVEFLRPWGLLALPLGGAALFALTRLLPRTGRKARISAILRYGILLLTALAVAGTSVLTENRERAAWLLVDVSASMDESGAVEAAREAIRGAENGMRVGVIPFAREAVIESPLRKEQEWERVYSKLNRSGSSLADALKLAAESLPEGAGGGIAVISDGLADADLSALPEGVTINTLKLAAEEKRDAQLTSLSVPASLYTGQKYSAVVTVHATGAGEATLLFLQNGSVTETRQVTLRRGENTFAFTCLAEGSGISTYEAQIILAGDQEGHNDRAGAFAAVTGEPRVLIAEGREGEGATLENILRASSIRAVRIPAAQLSASATELWSYDAVSLVNADADELSAEQTRALEEAVRELGVGLAVFGGDASYALGGYRGSVLEELLPVTMDVSGKLNLPSAALVLVIDKSGSMTDAQYGVTRLEVAKEAACKALEVLTERDQAGVIAFDDEGKWVVPVGYVTDAAAMQEQVGTIRPGGGTAFYTPLVMAHQALKPLKAQYKHVIFLTDGEPGDTGYQDVVRNMAADGITLTTVAVGDGADVRMLRKLADIGGGRAYAAGQFDNLPKIFTKETMMISGAYVQNRTFTPVVAGTEMTGFAGFPSLDGYLATTLKPLAHVSLISDREDPVLAWWQAGAGKTLAWTSDVSGGWSSRFLTWEDAAAFFAGLVSFVLPSRNTDGVLQASDGNLIYRLETPEGAASAEASVLHPDGTRETVPMRLVKAPEDGEGETVFAGSLEMQDPGSRAVHVTVYDAEGNPVAGTDGGLSVPWAEEYDQRTLDLGQLETLSERSGGKAAETAEELLRFPRNGAKTYRELTDFLLSLAALLFLFDIAQRRLNWFPEREPQPEKPEKTPKAVREKPAEEKQKPQAADELYRRMQNRKKM